jgi:hypothetical protein
MSQLVTSNADGLTKHVVDVLFKGESEIANIKDFRISGSKAPVRGSFIPSSSLGRLTPATSEALHSLTTQSAYTVNSGPFKIPL